MNNTRSCRLEVEFNRRWALNIRGGNIARLSRWRVLHWMILQRLGWHGWVRAPLFFGEKMWLLTGEVTSSALLGFGYSETALTALMLKVVRPGMHFVDIGAHLGYEALLASVLVGESGRVVSFEPQPLIAMRTANNLVKFPQTRLVQAAVADFNGYMEFSELDPLQSAFSGLGINAGTTQSISVRVTTLTDALADNERPVDFIKCDIEGAEMSMLRGATDILKKDRPFLVLEAEMPTTDGYRPRVEEFLNFLAPFGYRGISFDFDGKLKLAPLGGLHVGHANVAFMHSSRIEYSSLVQ